MYSWPPMSVIGGAATADVDDRLRVVDRVVERMDQVVLIGLDELGGGQRHCGSPVLSDLQRAVGAGCARAVIPGR